MHRRALDASALTGTLRSAPRPWQRVEVHTTIDSTSAEALRDPEPWRVVVAAHQSAGRGRWSRAWEAPPGAALAITAVLPVASVRAGTAGWLPLLAGMAMGRAVEQVTGTATGLKWPNDVLADEGGEWRKVCGVLAQRAPEAGGGPGRDIVVVGAGVNVDQSRNELPVGTATSLRLCRQAAGSPAPDAGGEQETAEVGEPLVVAYLDALERLHRAWGAGGQQLDLVRAQYVDQCRTLGQQVRIHLPDGTVRQGRAVRVRADGCLVVAGEDGDRAHAAGDVVHVRAGGTDNVAGRLR